MAVGQTEQRELALAFLLRSQEISLDDLKEKNVWHYLAAMNEELGEFCNELTIEEVVPGHLHKKVDEGTKNEGVDLVICALALYFARGGTIEHLAEYGLKKLGKWKDCIDKDRAERKVVILPSM